MRYIRMPRTDLRPSVVCLGGSIVEETPELMDCLDEYAALGGNCFDTANVYGRERPEGDNAAERILGDWMRAKGPSFRDKLILATKGGHPPLEDMGKSRLSRGEVAQDLEQSLRALQVDTVDLYWLHRDDRTTPVGEILSYLGDFVRQGKIRYFGASNWRADRLREAEEYAQLHGVCGFVANQPSWSCARVSQTYLDEKRLAAMDDEMFLFHGHTGLTVMPYSPNARGYLVKQSAGLPMSDKVRAMYDDPQNRARAELLGAVAAEKNCSVTALALAYLMAQPFPVIPIIGFSSLRQMRDSLSSVDVVLDLPTLNRLRGRNQLY